MRGVMFNGNRVAEIREFPDPHAGPGEAVVKIRASGMCGTDLHRYRGTVAVDAITGHEPCGVVAELGAGAPAGLAVGDRVVVHHYEGCGLCEICAMGFEQACPHGHVTFGGVDAPRRQRRLHPGAVASPGPSARGALVRRRSGHLLRHRHGLERSQEDERGRRRHRGDLRTGAGGPERDHVRQGHGCPGHRRRRGAGAAGAGARVRRGPRHQRRRHRPGGGHQGAHRRFGFDGVAGNFRQSRMPQPDPQGHAHLRTLLLRRHGRPVHHRLQKRRHLQGGHDLRLVDLQQVRAHRDLPLHGGGEKCRWTTWSPTASTSTTRWRPSASSTGPLPASACSCWTDGCRGRRAGKPGARARRPRSR